MAGLSDYTAPLVAELEDAFGVIRYQQRGLVPSAASGPFDLGRHVADAIAVLAAAGAGRDHGPPGRGRLQAAEYLLRVRAQQRGQGRVELP
ncbi:MAG: hypothetical protein WBF34_17040, partial [Streptosporangiaceae bacterium]